MNSHGEQPGIAALRQGLLKGPGSLPPAVRTAFAEGLDADLRLDAYASKVRDASTRITDGDIVDLRAAGCSEDEILEATLAAAFGAAYRRLQAGLAALAGEA